MKFKDFIQFNIDKRWFVLAFFLLMTVLSATQLPKLRFDFSPEAMLEFSDEEIAYQDAFNEKFSTNPNLFLVVFSSKESLIEGRSLEDLRDLTDMLAKNEGVEGTYSLARVPDNSQADVSALLTGKLPPLVPNGEIQDETVLAIKARIEQSGILRGNLISNDGKYALITASLDAAHSDPDTFYPLYERIAGQIENWQKDGHEKYEISYGGLPYIRAVTVDTMKREQLILWPIVGLLYVLALIVVFKSFWQAIMPLACIGCVILWAIAIMVLTDMPVTMINNTLPLLILVIGVTNGIYVIMRILDERRKGKDKRKAIADGVYRVALATLLTTSTTSIGFGSLLVAQTRILNGFGGITALAVMLIYVAIIFFMPQALSFIKLEPKRKKEVEISGEIAQIPEPDTGKEAHHPQHSHAFTEPNGSFEKFLDKVACFAIRFRYPIIAGAVILLVICLLIASHIRFNSKVNDVFQDGHPIAVTNQIIETELGGVLPVEVDLTAHEHNYFRKVETLARICAMQKSLIGLGGVISGISLCDLAAEGGVDWTNPPGQTELTTLFIAMNRLQKDQYLSFITPNGQNMHISLRIPDNGFEESKITINHIREVVDEALKGTQASYQLTGIGYNSTQGLAHFMSDLFTSLLTAFIIIFALLFISFRSVWSGLAAILPNVLPISMTLAFLPIYGYNFNTTTVLVFTISIGLAVDNSIHIIQRFRQEYRGDRTVEQALRVALRSSGRAIVQSNVLLCSGLAILLLSDFDPIGRVGTLTITTIASALAVSVILLPAEIACVGHRMKLPRFQKKDRPISE